MNKLSFVKLGQAIRQVFVDLDKYKFDKYVPEFEMDNKYFADCFNVIVVEPRGDKPPIFYHTFSPYDIVSKKAPDHALVFQNGKLILDADFTQHVLVRTGVMSPVVIRALGTDQLAGKVLLIGSGNVARQALIGLKEHFPGLRVISFHNRSGKDEGFEQFATEQGVEATYTDLSTIGEYDYIICHSSAQEPVLTNSLKQSLKPGAFIATFVSENFCEVTEEYYDTNEANVIIDWQQTIHEAKELQRAVDSKVADPDQMITLSELFTGSKSVNPDKKYTIYRSHGTPMQNLAVLKTLLNNAS